MPEKDAAANLTKDTKGNVKSIYNGQILSTENNEEEE